MHCLPELQAELRAYVAYVFFRTLGIYVHNSIFLNYLRYRLHYITSKILDVDVVIKWFKSKDIYR